MKEVELAPQQERAIIVSITFPGADADSDREEFISLVESSGAIPVGVIVGNRRFPQPKLFVGSGKAEEIKLAAEEFRADVVLFNHELSPGQERNLEIFLGCRVLDRTEVILDIFAQRAQSFEGKLQVELAQLQHLSTRLIRGWTHLERQKGGIGLRGPGETQLETDRRLIGHRIKQLKKRLTKVAKQRGLRRKSRAKASANTISLVGYTNAGKSTLFNKMTGADAYVADKLFATLDPTLRKVYLNDEMTAIMADTVGFIRHLPHELVASFQSTLEESREATLLMHVVDASCDDRDDTINQVNSVLQEIGADEVPQIEVYNKIDSMEGENSRVIRDAHGKPRGVYVSAVTGEGLDLLREVLVELLTHKVN